jgi:hypothetical protein
MPSDGALVEPDGSDAAAELRTAADDLEDALEAVAAEGGRGELREVSDALRSAERLLSSYEDSATGTGDFEAYVTFQEEFANVVEDLPEDLAARDAFEDALDAVEKRRLSVSDFETARERLAPARELADVLDEVADARDAFADARRRATDRLDAVESGIARRERMLELGDADLDAPVDDLRDPIAAYDDAVQDAFASYRSSASARDVLDTVATAASYPLVDVEAPPSDLADFVERSEAGEHSIPELLEYAGYSMSKLEHYVAEPQTLKSTVGSRRTYLDRLDGSGFAIGWPPPERETLKHVTRELVAVVDRFAGDDATTPLREVRELAWREDYESLRTAAVALDELGSEERDRLASGAVERELDALREERDALQSVLDETDDLA